MYRVMPLMVHLRHCNSVYTHCPSPLEVLYTSTGLFRVPDTYLHVCCIHYELCFITLGEMVPPKDFIEAIMGESLKDGTLK